MSIKGVSWAWDQNAGGPTAKVLLVVLGYAADDFGVAFLGRQALADRCECSPRAITSNLQHLEEKGLLARVERRRSNGSKTSTYTVLAPLAADRGGLLDAPTEAHPEEVMNIAQQGADPAHGALMSGDAGITDKVQNVHHQIVREDKSVSTPLPPEERIFAYWAKIMKHPKAKLDTARRRVIANALKHSSPDECARAILGCARSDFHMARGQYQGQTRYDKLSVILKNREQVEAMMDRAPQTPTLSASGALDLSVTDAKINEHKLNVRAAHDLAGSGDAKRRSDESERWLHEHGIRVLRDSDGSPRFASTDDA